MSTLGGRDSRRNRLSLLLVSRRLPRYRWRTLYVRGFALAVLAVAGTLSRPSALDAALLAPAALALLADLGLARRQRPTPAWLHGVWGIAALLLVLAAVRAPTARPAPPAALLLAVALVVVVSVSTGIFVEPSWYDPGRRTHPLARLARAGCGLLTAATTACLILPVRWPVDVRYAAWTLALLPLITAARTWNLDHTLATAVPFVREEGQRGRDHILREIHGALSTELRQLEQHARRRRLVDPGLYGLAVSANSSLRETLTLAEESRDTSTTADTLLAAVLTLARAEGASVTCRLDVSALSARDRRLARFVLNELVRAALGAGASKLDIGLVRSADQIVVSVATLADEGAGPRPDGGWSESVTRETGLSESVTWETGPAHTVRARWRAEP